MFSRSKKRKDKKLAGTVFMIVPLHVLKITTKSNFGAFWPKATWYLSDSAWLQKKMEFFAKLAPSFSYHTISYSWHNLVFQVLSIVSARFECTVWQKQFKWNVISLQNFKELCKNSHRKSMDFLEEIQYFFFRVLS